MSSKSLIKSQGASLCIWLGLAIGLVLAFLLDWTATVSIICGLILFGYFVAFRLGMTKIADRCSWDEDCSSATKAAMFGTSLFWMAVVVFLSQAAMNSGHHIAGSLLFLALMVMMFVDIEKDGQQIS